MPYIKSKRREEFEKVIKYTADAFECLYISEEDQPHPSCLCGGDLNYLITSICHQYIKVKGMNYQTFSDIMGALSGADKELYRTIIGPYEEMKRIENGRVSDIEG